MTEGPIRVLIIEDNPLDADLAREYMRETGCAVDIETVPDGQRAVELLDRLAVELESWPRLVLLDLNLPRLGGHEVLEQIRKRMGNDVAVYVYSGSRSPEDIRRSEGMANGFLRKPMGGQEIDELVANLKAIFIGLGAEC